MNESLDEKYLYYIADNYDITVVQAGLFIDQCIKSTSAILNVPYSEIYSNIFSEDSLKHAMNVLTRAERIKRRPDLVKRLEREKKQSAIDVLKNIRPNIEKSCNTMTIDECLQSNTCFVLDGECISRKIADTDLINEDPDKYVKNNLGKTEDLKRMVKIVSYLYHNYSTDITDNAFDSLEWHLKKRKKIKERVYEKIGAEPIEKLKTKLLYPMSSLSKVKPGTLDLIKFLGQFNNNKKCCWSLKLDGVSCMLIYDNYELTNLNTRGDGVTGGDVTYLKDFITKGLPRKVSMKYLVVRGELIISKQNWEDKYKGSYSNARAFVSGKVNSGFINSALHDIEFVCYEIMVIENEKTVPQSSQALKILEIEGFQIVDNGIFPNQPTTFEIMELYKKKRLESIYYIDGLVLTVDEIRQAIKKDSQSINPTYSVAFKMQLEEQVRSTKVLNVEWNISRYGRYVPIAIYEAVYTDGIRMTRATAHNAGHVQSWNMGKGTNIKVVRSGDVIPQIKDVEVDPNIIPIFPKTYEENGYEWHWEKSDIVLDKIEGNREVMIKRIVHFFETIEVPRLGQKTSEKFYDAGFQTPESIVKANVKDMIKIKGVGLKSAQMFYDMIRKVMTTVPPDRFIEASSSFKAGVGRVLLKQLFREIPNILNLTTEQIKKQFQLKKLPGFGPARISNVSESIPIFKTYLDSFAKTDIQRSIERYVENAERLKKDGYNEMIDGKTFVLTQMGFKTNYELEDYIWEQQGVFAGVVTSKTECVIAGNVGQTSKKMITASQLGVKVLFLDEFAKRYNVPLKRLENTTDDDED
jgi:DNA ligase (NAD+)